MEIANKFADFFKTTSGNLAPECSNGSVDSRVNHHNMYECRDWLLSVEDVDLGIRNNLQLGKAAGCDNIVAEHIIYAHPAVVLHLTKLFNLMLTHGYVPEKFGHSVVIPFINDRCGESLS